MKTQELWQVFAGAAFFILPALSAGPARAANFEICVANNADLKAALNQTQFTPVTTKIARGTYDLRNTVWHDGATNFASISSGSQLLGGYSADCSTRNIAVGNTVITDSGVADDDPYVDGNLTVEGLTFSLTGGRIEFIAGNPGFYNARAGSTITLRRDAFLNGSADDIAGVYWWGTSDSDGTIRIVDSLFAGNIAITSIAFVEVDRGNPKVEFINNTVVDNSFISGNGVGGVYFLVDGNALPKFYVYNNIIYGTIGSGSVDLYSDNNQVVLENNIFGTRNPFAPILSNLNLSVDPKLDANHRPIEVPQSPAINSGNNSPPDGLPSTDLDGGARIVGSVVDRGAYESSIDPSPTQTVTNTADDGSVGTLRAAINSVNSNGGGTIKFDIGTGCGPHVITLTAANGELPGLIHTATINGYSQTGASANTLDVGDDANICVILEAGTGASAPTRGLVVSSSAVDAVSVTIKGLAFSNFATTAIDLQGGSEHSIVGNHFGGSVDGYATQPNGFDIRLAAGTHDNTIGSGDLVDRNIIGDATGSGIVVLSGSAKNQIIGNYIGVGWGTGYTNRANGARGIYIAGDNNTISRNLIGYNAQAGIVVDSLGAHDNLIESNFIGADVDGIAVGNVGAGVHLIGDSGGTGDAPANNTIRLNTIADNGAQGVLVDVGQGNRIRKNSSYSNTLLGIDLGAVGVTANDDDGSFHTVDDANRLQNYPQIPIAQGGYRKGSVTGSLVTTPGVYTVDFYNSPGCDSSGNGEGKFWLGSASVTVPPPVIGNQGYGPISVVVEQSPGTPLLDGSRINATATDANGNTSEFSVCATYLNDTLFTDGFDPAP